MTFHNRMPDARTEIVRRLLRGGNEIGLRVETEAKAELYPGHGKRTGRLQRGIQSQGARLVGRVILVRVGVKGVPYARAMQRRYRYMTIGASRVAPRAREILAKHLKDG